MDGDSIQPTTRSHQSQWPPDPQFCTSPTAIGQAPWRTWRRSEGSRTAVAPHGTREQAIAEGRFVGEADQLKLYKKLATMDPTAPLPSLDDQAAATWANAAVLARQ
jgi:hypothetical protein